MSTAQQSNAVVGIFSFVDSTVAAIRKVNETGLTYRVYSPIPNHEIEEVTFPERSPVRYFTLAGGIIGCTAGFSLAILCSLDWPLRVSAKNIVSIPGFFVIGYECMILFGALATLGAMAHFCRIPDIFRRVGYDPRFTEDKFGVVIGCPSHKVEELKKLLVNAGAEEVEVHDAL